ncbi:hypothetical protein NA57DRAFT_37564 [Rhizodiscina lignyota]|uniref:Uncharacterized protein n=1 Tax=Rhizodiscina lignyota TaxID=1504668 RepID=A0A9P4IHS1_9PEZI|nr:hypothetical protein NA57DRAFT_37564 [Rhizodiscina lignyota]
MADSSSREPNLLPGFGLPVRRLPKWRHWKHKEFEKPQRFPHAISDFVASTGVTIRERRMLKFIDQISDKPEWDRKVFDDDIIAKWKEEAVRHVEDLGDKILSEKMFDYCIAELQDKAKRFQETGTIAVLDAEATIVKSDNSIPSDLKQALRDGVKPLEGVPERLKDWHPGSDNKVLDLVHPSLFPWTYGLSRALRFGAVPLDACTSFTGMGEIEETVDEDFKPIEKLKSWGDYNLKAWGKYQWLPSDVHFTEQDGIKIASYINNLHPQQNEKLYHVLEKAVQHAIPLWNECLSWFHDRVRIVVYTTSDEDYFIPEGIKYQRPERSAHSDDDGHESDDSDYLYTDEYRDWKEEHRILKQPEPRAFISFASSVASSPEKEPPPGACPVDLRKDFPKGLQVIFKLANIHLTPEKPEYDGSSWHVEGALNEHICATALYYYDSYNITESRLEFRQAINAEEMTMRPGQYEYDSLEEYYGILNENEAIQELGSVATREGRLLAFPNVMQHRVRPFSLADRTKDGHRKILVMFLVDPNIRVLSTAHVPPQRKDWWADEVRKIPEFEELPQELFDRIIEGVEGFPMSWDEALNVREKLMAERGAMKEALNTEMSNVSCHSCLKPAHC